MPRSIGEAKSKGRVLGVSQLCTETLMAGTRFRFIRNVKKGATLQTGELGVSPSLIFIPFPKRKGSKGMVGTLMNSFDIRIQNFLYKAGVSPGALNSPSKSRRG